MRHAELERLGQIVADSETPDEAVARLARVAEVRARVLDAELLRPNHDCLVMTETPEGLRYFFSLRDTFVGIPIAVGVFEQDVDRAMNKVLRPGMNCIDVGANLGYYSMRMAAVVGPGGGRVISFEPDDLAFHLLGKNLRENRFDSIIEPHQAACGERDEQAFLFKDTTPGNYGGMYVRTEGGEPHARAIAICQIDNVVPKGVPIHLVKIDVEGFEPFVLRGMKRILTEDRPILLLEFNQPALQHFGDDAPSRLLVLLESFGYMVYEAGLFADGVYRPFERDAAVFTNLICMPRPQTK